MLYFPSINDIINLKMYKLIQLVFMTLFIMKRLSKFEVLRIVVAKAIHFETREVGFGIVDYETLDDIWKYETVDPRWYKNI